MADPRGNTADGLRIVASLTARGDELGEDGRVGAPHLLSWCEHARWQALAHHGGSAGAGGEALATLTSGGRLIVVRSQALAVYGRVSWGQEVWISLALTRVGRTSVGLAQSLWIAGETPQLAAELRLTAVSLGSDRRPAEVPAALHDAVQPVAEPDAISALKATPIAVDHPVFRWQQVVRASEIDVFHHVNHARYGNWLLDAVHDAAAGGAIAPVRKVLAMSVDYARELVVGERFEVVLQDRGHGRLDAAVLVADQPRATMALQAAS